jgi:hypothetical protein
LAEIHKRKLIINYISLNLVLTEYFNTENLKLAYYRVICWPDRLVKDRFGIHAFGANLETNLIVLSEKIISGNYNPQTGFKFYEPKSSGTQRTKTLLMIEDAMVYQAISNKIAQKVYPQLAENENFVFGSVLAPDVQLGQEILKAENPNFFFFKFWKSLFGKFKESVIKAIEEDKATYKFETDITGFFDSIPHYNLLLTLSSEFGVEDEILDILSQCFNAWSGTKDNSTPGVGIPQGPQPSFFFANLLLHPLDKQVIGDGHKYYRYMDDIKIYGYSEEDLLDILVQIDNYLKSHGLSINSKKTSIQKIDAASEDETVKEFRRIAIMGDDYDGVSSEITIQNNTIDSNIIKNLSSLFEQTNDDSINTNGEFLSNPEEIIEFWESEIKIVEEELPALFKTDSIELVNPDKTDDIDFIRYSAKYGTALRALKEVKTIEVNQDLLKYWLFALKKYFWRASNYVITLQYYKDNPILKKELKELYKYGKNYECYRYHVVNCMTYNFNYQDKELRDFFKILKEEKSVLVKYAIYCLIIKHSNDPQLLSTIKGNISIEQNQYLKLIVLDYWKNDTNRADSMQDLIKSVGL